MLCRGQVVTGQGQPGCRTHPGSCCFGGSRHATSTEGAAGTIWTTVRLRNVSGRTCTVAGFAQVRLLDADGAPVTAPSVPDGPGGSRIALRPGQAVTFAYGEPNVCDSTVAGSRIRVTLPNGRGSVIVGLGAEARYGTCAPVHVQAMRRATGLGRARLSR